MTTFDFRNVNISQVDPSAMNLGTDMQDCALIAQIFERGAHSTPTEPAVFATLNRTLGNSKAFSSAATTTLSSYLTQPQVSAAEATSQAASLAAAGGVSVGGGAAATLPDGLLQSLNIGNLATATLGTGTFGKTMAEWAKNCIPCGLRLTAFLELNPSANLLSALEDDLKNRLKALQDVGDLLGNIDLYGDYCNLLNALSFMCVPDLQRLISTLMAMFILEVPQLDGLIGILSTLVAPLFAPLFTALTALLDQFVQLITNPLECMMDVIEQQASKLEFDVTVANTATGTSRTIGVSTAQTQQSMKQGKTQINNVQKSVSTSLKELNLTIEEAKQTVERKLEFYVNEIKAMFSELGAGDGAYLRLSMRKLRLTRLMSFVAALITAMVKGKLACAGTGKTPAQDEIDTFFNNFLNPQSPFNMYVGEDGLVRIEEKTDGFDDALLSNSGNVFQFKGNNLLDPTFTALTQPVRVVTPCKISTTASDVEKVNAWIAQLDEAE